MSDLNVVSISNARIPADPFVARHLIDGDWRSSTDGATFERVSPSHDAVVTVACRGNLLDVDAAICAARRAFDE